MTKIAVVIAGCGHIDGAEIRESLFTLLHLSKQQLDYQVIAPNRPQHHVVNHLTGEEIEGEQRNILIESARIARGEIIALDQADPNGYDAIIFPGGTGAAKNLFNLALVGPDYEAEADILQFAKTFVEARKPMGFICIMPMLIPLLFPNGATLTTGALADVAAIAEAKGSRNQPAGPEDIVTDQAHKIVCTPAYMHDDARLEQVEIGVGKLVAQIKAWL